MDIDYSRNISSHLCLPFTHLSFGCHVHCFKHPWVSMKAWVSHTFTDSPRCLPASLPSSSFPAHTSEAHNKIPRWFLNALQFEKHFTRSFLGVQLKVITSMKVPLILLSNLFPLLSSDTVTYFLLCFHLPSHSPSIHPCLHPRTPPTVLESAITVRVYYGKTLSLLIKMKR